MPTVLRASGVNFDVDAFLAKSKFKPYRIYHKGDPRSKRPGKTERSKESGLCLDAADADFDDLPGQIRQTMAFLKRNQKELKKLTTFPGVEAAIDFGFTKRDVIIQFDRFPAELIRLAGALGLAIEISLYPPSENPPDSSKPALTP